MSGANEMRSDEPGESAHLGLRFAHEAEVTEPEIAQPAVDELRRGTRRARGEVVALDESDLETVPGRHLSDARTDDPAADDEQIERFAPKALESRRALGHADARFSAHVHEQ